MYCLPISKKQLKEQAKKDVIKIENAAMIAAAKQKEQDREKDFHRVIDSIDKQIKAFGSQGLGCNHTHHAASNPLLIEAPMDSENQAMPEFPTLEIEEAEDFAIQAGKAGEFVTSLGGALAIGPILDLLVILLYPKATESPWFTPLDTLEVSPAILLVSLILIAPAAYGAPHCHAKLEIASRTRNNFIILAKYTQRLLQWGDKNKLQIDDPQLKIPMIKIGNKEILIDHFVLIDPSDSAPLSFKQKFQIFGDVEQHYNEYVGLTIIAILRNINNPIAQFILIGTVLVVAGIACKPEVTTCLNTLILMNELEKGKIIDNPDATNKANCQTTFSAIAKTPAVLYANFLSFQQICFGNFYAGLALALLATKGNIVTQFFINNHTGTKGEAQSNSIQALPEDKRSTWQKLTLLGKELVISRAFGTGNERSEPITLTIIALVALAGPELSSSNQAVLALFLCLAGTITAYSEARNAADHTARVRFFNSPLPIVSGIKVPLLTGVVAN